MRLLPLVPLGCLLPLLLVATLTQADDRLNVLFIAVDDMNCSLGCYGNADVASPHIDALAERGVLFERAYCQQAVCNPSRASIMTGLRPDTVQVWDLRADFRDAVPDAVTLPQMFKQQGYHTQCIGKIYHNMGGLNDEPSWSVPSVMHEGRHSDDYQLPPNRPGIRKGKGPYFERGDLPDDAYLDGQIATSASQAIHQFAETDQPFFLAVGFWRPHLPFLAPKEYWSRYEQSQPAFETPGVFTPPENAPAIALHDSRELFGYGGVDRENVDAIRRHLWQGYYAGISYVDEQFGRVIAALDDANLTDRTVIVFWSDHGFHLGQHGLWCKTSCFELDARVPMIIAPPKCPIAGSRTDAIVELLDVYPTLADLCGLSPPANLEGRSLKPLLVEPTKQTLRFFAIDDPDLQRDVTNDGPAFNGRALTQHPRPAYFKGEPEVMGYSLRTDGFRYTEWRDWTTGDVVARELYDHENDPHETVNEADSARFNTVISTHSQQLSGLLSTK